MVRTLTMPRLKEVIFFGKISRRIGTYNQRLALDGGVTVSTTMNTTPSLHQPQTDFVQRFLRPEQLQRMLIYFSKQKPTDSYSRHGFSDIVVRLINDPLTIIFGEHGVYLFSNYLLVYPYNELDASQLAYITQFLSMHVPDLPVVDLPGVDLPGVDLPVVDLPVVDAVECNMSTLPIPSVKVDVRVTKQMGGGYTVRPVQLTNIRLDTFQVLSALVRGIMYGSQKHDLKYRQHAVNLQLQRILTRIVVSRAQLHSLNNEIETCMNQHAPVQAPSTVSDAMVECG
jgi:hypothetical protein